MNITDILGLSKKYLKNILDASKDKENEAETIDNILKSINFRGSNLWVLIFAIFIASLGLNVNSTAVIIGAMLISPLMGPIMGIGLGVGINDFELIKKAFRNLFTATIFGILTSTLYFLISPLNEARSELLARTTPTIYDILIAFFGGMAGIVASSTRLKGNVIPGVAIATALMPPLCTAGFGLASGRPGYFFGAFYLYLINSVFIAFATTLGVKLMHFPPKTFVDKKRGKKVRHIIYSILFLTIIPSIYITHKMIRNNIFETNAAHFIANEINYPNTLVIGKHIRKDSISVTLIGKELPEEYILFLHQKMEHYNLKNCKLHIVQDLGNNSEKEKNNGLDNLILQDFYQKTQAQSQRQESEINRLRNRLNDYAGYDSLGMKIAPEIRILFPEIQNIALAKILRNDIRSSRKDTLTVAILSYSSAPSEKESRRFREWLSARIGTEQLELIEKRTPGNP